ncbi:MAG: hypothetical protein NZ561_09570 [Phycisphaerae bacterium]|nr:hypothetical protein [Phycisphaerae bacterium]
MAPGPHGRLQTGRNPTAGCSGDGAEDADFNPFRWAGPLLLVALFLLLAWLTWMRLLDGHVDFGREVYVPWRLSEGEALYRDIEYFNGPLSAYVHSVIFRIFGAGISYLAWFNLCISGVMLGLLYALLRCFCGAFGATAGCALVLVGHVFAHLSSLGNYSFVQAYSHELSQGVALSVGMLWVLHRLAQGAGMGYACLGGLLLGLISLTKAEVLLAAVVAWMGAWGLIAASRRAGGREIAGPLIGSLICAVIPVVVAFGLLCLKMAPSQAASGLAGSWKYLGNRELTHLPFFQRLAGTDNPGESLLSILRWLGGYVALLGVGLGASWLLRGVRGWVCRAGSVGFAVVVVGVVGSIDARWSSVVRPMPLILAGTVVIGAIGAWRNRADANHLARRVAPMGLALLGLGLTPKMLLNLSMFHYGFALAMPSTALLAGGAVGWLPRWVARRGLPGAPCRAAALGALLAIGATLALISARHYLNKPITVGAGADRYHALPYAAMIDAAARLLAEHTSPDSTVVAVPDGQIIGYLARRRNPTPHLQFTRPAQIMFGQTAMLNSLRATRPDFVVLVHADETDYAARFFGRDYGQSIARWIETNYTPIWSIGAEPFTSGAFGVRILRRADHER